MSRSLREVARLRQELRDRLMTDHPDGANDALARFRRLIEGAGEAASAELRHEYERWKMRFELLLASARRKN